MWLHLIVWELISIRKKKFNEPWHSRSFHLGGVALASSCESEFESQSWEAATHTLSAMGCSWLLVEVLHGRQGAWPTPSLVALLLLLLFASSLQNSPTPSPTSPRHCLTQALPAITRIWVTRDNYTVFLPVAFSLGRNSLIDCIWLFWISIRPSR